jgi:type IV secretory pathway ATPase VirB11/archaellum biosynthesis ATPase
MVELTLTDLVGNRTMSPEMAATLAVAAEERRSLLFVAIPRMAGKSTTMRATLEHVPAGTPIHLLSRGKGPRLGIPSTPDGGYLLASEIADTGFDDYLWGDEARTMFAALQDDNFSLVTALHAGSLEEAFRVITRLNNVPDAHAARLDLVIYIRSVGDWRQPVRRAVAAMYEIHGVANGRPDGRLLHRWSEPDDRFEVKDEPRRIGGIAGSYEKHLAAFMARPPNP